VGWAEFALTPPTLALGQSSEGMPTSPGGDGGAVALGVDGVEAALDDERDAGTTVRMDAIERSVCDVAVVEDPDGSPLMLQRRHGETSVRRAHSPDRPATGPRGPPPIRKRDSAPAQVPTAIARSTTSSL